MIRHWKITPGRAGQSVELLPCSLQVAVSYQRCACHSAKSYSFKIHGVCWHLVKNAVTYYLNMGIEADPNFDVSPYLHIFE